MAPSGNYMVNSGSLFRSHLRERTRYATCFLVQTGSWMCTGTTRPNRIWPQREITQANCGRQTAGGTAHGDYRMHILVTTFTLAHIWIHTNPLWAMEIIRDSIGLLQRLERSNPIRLLSDRRRGWERSSSRYDPSTVVCPGPVGAPLSIFCLTRNSTRP